MSPEWLAELLEANKNKDFVQRIINPSNYPTMELGPDAYGTHKTSHVTEGNKAIVYPHIIHRAGKLELLDRNSAYEYARKNNEYLEMTPAEAEWFGKNYKSYGAMRDFISKQDMQRQIKAMNKSGW